MSRLLPLKDQLLSSQAAYGRDPMRRHFQGYQEYEVLVVLEVLEDGRVPEVCEVLEGTELPEETEPGAPERGGTVVDVVPEPAAPPTGFEPR